MTPSTIAITIVAIAATALLLSPGLPLNAQSTAAPVGDALYSFPLLEDQGWFIHAHDGRVRACSVDGASVVDARTAPRCSDWSD